jgi:methylated-DNA-[protein]-cysteine S-methyltransferase
LLTSRAAGGQFERASLARKNVLCLAMVAVDFCVFDTPIGCCAIAWSDRGIRALQLPERSEALTRSRLWRRFSARETAPPEAVEQAISAIVALLHGEKRDLTSIALDMEGVPPFHQRVYEITRTIPAGATLTYGEIAQRLEEPAAARAVGQALGRNPFALLVPCHRVLAAGNKLGGFSAEGGVDVKRRLLAIEGAMPRRADLFDQFF